MGLAFEIRDEVTKGSLPIRVRDLLQMLEGVPPTAIIAVSSDSEGNMIQPCLQISCDEVKTIKGGRGMYQELEFTGKEVDKKEDANVLIFWPAN
jgi:hypothetical protein